MSLKKIELKAGDILIVSVPKEAPPKPEEELEVLLTIPPVSIFHKDNGAYVCFVSDLDICNDGSGPAHGDQYHQAQTAYYSGGIEGGKYLNADVDKYIVIPPQIRAKVPGVVMGCRGRVTNLKTQVFRDGVIGDIGPDNKTGECAYCLAKLINPNVEYNSGDKDMEYFYELWPDVPAKDGDFTYKLQPAG